MLLECPQCRSDVRWSSVLSRRQTPRLQLVPDPDCTETDSSAAAAALFTFLLFLSFKFGLWWQQVCLCKSLWFTNRGMKSITEQQMCVCVCARVCVRQTMLTSALANNPNISRERMTRILCEFGGVWLCVSWCFFITSGCLWQTVTCGSHVALILFNCDLLEFLWMWCNLQMHNEICTSVIEIHRSAEL